MKNTEATQQQDYSPLIWAVAIILGGSSVKRLLIAFGMERPIAFMLATFLCWLVAYRLLPLPRKNFKRYALAPIALLLSWYLAFFVIQPELKNLIPEVVSIWLLVYAVFLVGYLAMRALSANVSFGKWAGQCLLFATILAPLIWLIPESK